MDWIDDVIRYLCEMPDRSSPEDDPEAIISTAAEIRSAIEANCPFTARRSPALTREGLPHGHFEGEE